MKQHLWATADGHMVSTLFHRLAVTASSTRRMPALTMSGFSGNQRARSLNNHQTLGSLSNTYNFFWNTTIRIGELLALLTKSTAPGQPPSLVVYYSTMTLSACSVTWQTTQKPHS